jgi:myo-inositol-1(or 4)-monophosphatase
MFQSKVTPSNLSELARLEATCESAARMAGSILLEHFGKTKAWKKDSGDWVTQADIEAQRAIRTHLLNEFPDHLFLGEESSTEEGQLRTSKHNPIFRWIVDPLDGTVNFLHQLRSFSTSVALVRFDPESNQPQVITGAVIDPLLDECYVASIGKGARLNGSAIQVSECRELERALTVFSTNNQISPTDPQVTRMLNVMGTRASLRRMGSAALNLCYLACGRVDAYWATSLNSWDVAAGWLIANEAGAIFESLDNTMLDVMNPKFCSTSTKELMDHLRPLLRI